MKKRKIIAHITFTPGSDFQYEFIRDVLRTTLRVIHDNAVEGHKQNKFEYFIEGANDKI